MFGGQFIAKTMMLIFSIPFMSYADINIDLKSMGDLFGANQEQVDKESLKLAINTLSSSAALNTSVTPEFVPASYNPETDTVKQQQFQQVITNLNSLTEKL